MIGVGVPELALLVGIVLVVALLVAAIGRSGGRRQPVPVGPPPVVPAELQSRLRTLAGAGQRIQAIKELRQATGLSLLDAKNAVDSIAAGNVLPVPGRTDLAYRARGLASAGRDGEAVRLVSAETGMSAPEAQAFVRALLGRQD